MAKTLSKSGIATGQDILAKHVTQSIDALTGVDNYDINISGSLTNTGSVNVNGDIISTGNISATNFTASNAFHAQAGAQFEFTISGSQFNMVNQAPNKNLFFLTTTGTGGHHFGTNNINSQVIIGTGGHITASGDISVSNNVIASRFLVSGGGSSAPGLSFTIDDDTGLFQGALGNLSLQINGGVTEFSLNTNSAVLNAPLIISGGSDFSVSASEGISAFGSSSLTGLPTSKPSVTGSLWLSGSAGQGSQFLVVYTGA